MKENPDTARLPKRALSFLHRYGRAEDARAILRRSNMPFSDELRLSREHAEAEKLLRGILPA